MRRDVIDFHAVRDIHEVTFVFAVGVFLKYK